MSQPSITCPACGWTSWNSGDVKERYCGNCHQYHDDVFRRAAAQLRPARTSRRAAVLRYLRTRQAITRGQLWGLVLMAWGIGGFFGLAMR